jgi:hypothetical protein
MTMMKSIVYMYDHVNRTTILYKKIRMLFNFHIFIKFPIFLLPLISNFILLCLENIYIAWKVYQAWFSSSDISRLVFELIFDLFWRISYMLFRWMCIFLLLCEMFCICLLGLFGVYIVQILCFLIAHEISN